MDTTDKKALELAMAKLIQGGRDVDTMTDEYFAEIDRRSEEKYRLESRVRRLTPR